MSNDKADAVREFFGDPDKEPPMSPVVEKLLPYLDASSTLHLVQSKISCLKQHLQTTSVVWKKLVNRTLPPGDFKVEIEQGMLRDSNRVNYTNRVRESFEEKRILMASLVNLLKMLEKPDSHILHLLEVICAKSPQDEIPVWRGPNSTQAIQIGSPSHGSSYSVSPLGFLLLEDVEANCGSALQEVSSIKLKYLEEPWLSAIASRVSRQQEKMTKMEVRFVKLPTKESIEALFTLVQNSVTVVATFRKERMFLEITGNIEVEGWVTLAKALALAPSGWVYQVRAPVDLVKEGRRGDLRTVWDSLGDYAAEFWIVGNTPFKKYRGEREWRALEQLLDKN